NYDAMIDNPVAGRDVAATEVRLLRGDGTRIEVEVRRHALKSGDDWVIVAVLRDITARREAEERLHRLAHYDALTGLPNRTLFYSTLTATLAAAAKQGSAVAVLFMDLDRFKNVNDTLGHAAGDNLLRQYATRLVECAGRRETIGRLGGDEFALILTMENAPAGAVHEISQIREAMRAPFDLDGQQVIATTSVGISIYPDDAHDAQILIKFADTAMYSAKQAGRDTFRFFTAQMNDEFMARLDMESAVRRAVENNEFSIHYQTKVDLGTNLIVGLEALLRWNRPDFGPVSPVDFVPVLEETGLIVQVGKQVIDTACQQIAEWQCSDIGKIPISVNVSAWQLVDDEFEAHILSSLDRHSVSAELLELELTESTLMVNTDRTISALRSLRDEGVRISIDDFGTGYSSLAYLRRFPIDKVKIDKAFINDITKNPDDAAIVNAIIQMSHSLRLSVIAEGVETAEQLAYLREHGCDEAQGFYFSKPEPAEAAAMRLSTERVTHFFPKQNSHWHASAFNLLARVFRPETDQPAADDLQGRETTRPTTPHVSARAADEAA
ncbi:MAG: EAL domain-containing protein, partial [Sphingobacteriales bacterium]